MKAAKYLVISAILAMAPANAMAQSKEEGTRAMLEIMSPYCEGQADMAEFVMSKRQEGEPLQDVMEFLRKTDTQDPEGSKFPGTRKNLVEFAKKAAMYVYTEPRQPTPEKRREAVVEFSSQAYRVCYEQLKKAIEEEGRRNTD